MTTDSHASQDPSGVSSAGQPAESSRGGTHAASTDAGAGHVSAQLDQRLREHCESSTLVHEGAFLTVKCDKVRLPDGKLATREYVQHAGAVMILPLFDDGTVLVEKQFRYPLGRVLTEYPAGKLDPGEDPVVCAHRELLEETGYSASQMTFLTRINPVISYSTEFIDLYLARGLTPGRQQLDEGEFLELEIVSPQRMIDAVRSGQISDVKTIIGTFWLEKILSGAWPLPA